MLVRSEVYDRIGGCCFAKLGCIARRSARSRAREPTFDGDFGFGEHSVGALITA